MFWSILISSFAVVVVVIVRTRFRKRRSLKNDTVLITGAGCGIGRLLCVELAKHCEKVIGWDINDKGLKETADLVKSETGAIMKYQHCDVGNPDEVNECASRLQNESDRVTILINNAGIVKGNYILQQTGKKFEQTMRVNLFASFYTTKAVLPNMLGSAYEKTMMAVPEFLRISSPENQSSPTANKNPPKGHLVYISSVLGLAPMAGLSDYCATKAGLLLLADSLRLELDKLEVGKEIKITTVLPYAVNTGMFDGLRSRIPFCPILKQQDVAKHVVGAIMEGRTSLYLPWYGCLLPIVVHVFPYWLSRTVLKLIGAIDAMDEFARADLTT